MIIVAQLRCLFLYVQIGLLFFLVDAQSEVVCSWIVSRSQNSIIRIEINQRTFLYNLLLKFSGFLELNSWNLDLGLLRCWILSYLVTRLFHWFIIFNNLLNFTFRVWSELVFAANLMQLQQSLIKLVTAVHNFLRHAILKDSNFACVPFMTWIHIAWVSICIRLFEIILDD